MRLLDFIRNYFSLRSPRVIATGGEVDLSTHGVHMSLINILKNLFFILLIIYLVPPVLGGIKKQYEHYASQKTQVGIISLQECIQDSSILNKQLHSFFKNHDIKAILLKIDCSGGSSGSCQTVHDELKALKHDYPKPVIVVVENCCASGAYYIASASDYIVAPGMALIGNIGTCFAYLFQLREFIEQYKIKYVPIKAGAYKTVGDRFTDITPQEKELLQGVLDDSYQQFITDVAANRKLSVNDSKLWADGKIFSGRQAKELGLIDEIGSMYQAIRALKDKALIEGEIEWVKAAQESPLTALFPESSSDVDSPYVAAFVDKLCSRIEERYLTQKIR